MSLPIPLFVSISSCLGELFTECTSDDQYRISLPYSTANSTLLSAKAGVCTEKDVTYVQDASTFNVTIDIERCKLNTKTYPKPKVQQKALFQANVTNLKVGRRGNGMNYTYLDLDISTECGRQMEYQVTHQYGAISSAGAATPDVGVNETDAILPGHKPAFTFAFTEHTNLFFNETRPTGPRQAGRKSYVSITATNMNVAEHTFTVPSCKMTTTSGREQMLFSSLTEENSFIDLYKDYRVENNKNVFLLSHIFFVLDRNPTARYNLTCTVRVCPKQYKGRHSFIGETCDIIRSCSQRPCYHGTCQDSFATTKVSTATDYTCKCDAGFNGTHCETHVQAGQPCTVNSDCASGDCRSGRCCRVGNDDGCSACDDKGFCTTCDGTETCDSTYCVRGKCIIPRINTNRDIYASCGSKDTSYISYDYYGLDTDGLPMWKTDPESSGPHIRFIKGMGSTWACTNRLYGVLGRMADCTTDHVPDANSNSCFESHGYTAPIDGSWADWTPFTSCSSSCGNGTQTFNRTCTKPAPQSGGADCEGQATKIGKCNLQECTSVSPQTVLAKIVDGQFQKKRTRVSGKTLYAVALFENKIYTAGTDTHIYEIDFSMSDPVRSYKSGHSGGILCIDATDDLLVTGSGDKTVRLWRRQSMELIYTIKDHSDGLLACKIKEKVLVTTSRDKTAIVYQMSDQEAPKKLYVLSGHADWVRAVDVSTEHIVTVTRNSKVMLWNRQTGELLKTMRGHSSEVYSVRFLDASHFASLGGDVTLKIWNVNEENAIKSLANGEFGVSIAVHDNIIYSTQSNSKSIRVWDFSAGPESMGEASVKVIPTEHTSQIEASDATSTRIVTAAQDGHITTININP